MGLFDRFFGPPNKKRFAQLVMKTLRDIGDTRNPTFDEGEYRLVFSDQGKDAGVLNLRNLYIEYCNVNRKDRDAMLRRNCISLARPLDLPEDFEDVVPDLLPSIRPKSMLDVMRLDVEIQGGEWQELATLPLSEHLVISLVYDLPNSMQFIHQKKIDDWGITLYEAAEIAQRNLAEKPFSMASIGDKLYVVMGGDAFDATRMLLLDAIRSLTLQGEPVAMPVNRDTLLVTGSDDVEGLEIMANLAEAKKDEARPICPIAHQLVGDDWEVFSLAPDHPHFEKFRMLELKYLYGEYDEQKKLLEKSFAKKGKEDFVASFSAFERDGKVTTYAVWSKGVPTLLPKTEYIGLFDPETEMMAFAAWDRVQRIVADMMSRQECYPSRWYVDDFPTPAQLQEIGAEKWAKGG